MTKTRARILARMNELAGGGSWTVVPSNYGAVIRWTRSQPVPEFIRSGTHSPYPFEDYDRHVFLTLVGQVLIMQVCPAPWVRCTDRPIPLWLAQAVMDDPELAFDTQRQLDLKHARRGGRGGDGVRR